MSWFISIIAALGIALAGLGLWAWVAMLRFDAHAEDLKRGLTESQSWPESGSAELPELVRSYAVRAGGRIGATELIHSRQRALLSTTQSGPPIQIDADQWTGTIQPGIVWLAGGKMNGLPVRVLDAFVRGHGELDARLVGIVTVAGGTGDDYDKGELLRYLSELPTHPDAILNIASLEWRLIDERTAEVSARSATGTARLRFIFDGAGDVVGMQADDRPMSVDGKTVPMQWHGTYGDYRQFGRYRLPSHGEVGWVLPGGLFTYWRGELVGYEPVPRQ